MLAPPPLRAPAALVLIRLGIALLVLGYAVSLAASPLPSAGLPWAVQGWAGAAAAWAAWVWGGRPSAAGALRGGDVPDRRAVAVERCAVGLGYVLTALLPTITRWPAYKFQGLTSLYGALPSLLRYLPDRAAQGVSPNQTGGVLAAVAALAVCLLLLRTAADADSPRDRGTRGGRAAPAVLSALSGTFVLLSGSRAALAALVAALLVVALLRDRRSAWAVAGLTVGSLAAVIARPSLPRELMARLLHEEPLQAKLLARADIWASALRGIADHPFAGIGLGTLNDVLPARYPYGSVGLDYSVSQAHNIVLDTALTMGVPAALGLVSLVAGLLIVGFHSRSERTHTSKLVLGLVAVIIVFVVFGMTDALSLSSPTSLVLWMTTCGVFATGYIQRRVSSLV